jgi:uncharacterized protein (DUF433 family)
VKKQQGGQRVGPRKLVFGSWPGRGRGCGCRLRFCDSSGRGLPCSGAWLFKGTRVPVAALFENLESGATVDDFLQWFQGVAREQVEAVLKHAEKSLAVAQLVRSH